MAGSNQKNLDIVIRGRNEAKGALKSANRDVAALGSNMLKLVAGGAAISMASKAGAAGVMGRIAAHERAAALAKGDLEGVLEAQVKVNTAWSEFGGSIPLIGESVKKAMDSMFNVEAMREAIANVKELEQAAQKMEETLRNQIRETARLKAMQSGATPEEKSALELSFRTEDRPRKMEEMKKAELEAIKKAGKAYDILQVAKVKHDSKLLSDHALWLAQTTFDRESKLVDELFAKRKQLAQETAQAQVADVGIQNDKEIAAARQRAEQALAATQSVGGYLASDEERNVERVKAEGAKMKALAQKYGGDVAGVERETARRVAEVRQAARDKETQEEKRAAEEKAKEREKNEQERAKTKASFDDIIFNATHTAKERELRELKKSYKEAAALYADDEEMRKSMQAAYAIQEAEINKRHAGDSGTPRNVEVQAMSSRFLTRAQGRDDPKWAQEANKEAKKHSALLELIADKVGITVDEVRLN